MSRPSASQTELERGVRETLIDEERLRQRVAELAGRYGFDVDPDAIVGTLPVGMQQRVEILRALYQGGKTLILDEPTALLTPQEVDELYGVLTRLRQSGVTIIFITHKLREVAAISERVTVPTIGWVPMSGNPFEEMKAPSN